MTVVRIAYEQHIY